MRKKYFFNISNHPSKNWSEKQINEALKLAEKIVDIEFPNVPADYEPDDVMNLVEKVIHKIMDLYEGYDYCVLVQGEFSLTFALTELFLSIGVDCYVATSERNVKETVIDGKTEKKVIFEFVKFRKIKKYEILSYDEI